MDQLQGVGYSFLMDDFGSGFFSLNVLKDIPVDIIKIDMDFLKDARRGNERGRGVLQGAIRLVHDLGLPVIVEGVETNEPVELLMNLGCAYAQGFRFALPMPAADIKKLVEAGRQSKDFP